MLVSLGVGAGRGYALDPVSSIGVGRFRILGGGEGMVQNIWGGGGGGARGAKLFAGCKLIGAPVPKSVPNNYISHIENRYYSKIKNRIENYTL